MPKANYSTPNTSAWRDRANDLFLARYRGRPCEICGATFSVNKGIRTRSMFHHLISKEHCRAHQFNRKNGVVLCPDHHTRFTGNASPHSKNGVENGLFYEWLFKTHPDLWEWVKRHYEDSSEGCVTYKEAYVRLGGQITPDKLKKDQKPLNHGPTKRAIEAGVK